MSQNNNSFYAWSQLGNDTDNPGEIQRRIRTLYNLHRGISKYHDWQEECLRLRELLASQNVILNLPTSGGKTLVAENLIMEKILLQKKNAIFVLPFVSMVNEKVSALSPFGVDLGFYIHEYAGSRGRFPPIKHTKKKCAYVCTIEKAVMLVDSLLEQNRLAEIGIMVVDELHLIGDESRGSTLESLLIKVMASGEKIQLVGMSATIGNLEQIARFIDATIYSNNFRPLELKEFVKVGNELFEYDGKLDPPMRFVKLYQPKDTLWKYRGMDTDEITSMVLDVIPESSCLVFCHSKSNCENLAKKVCYNLPRELISYNRKEKDDLCSQLVIASDGFLCPILAKTLPFGVAYHHSGLTMEERKLLEEAYNYKTINVIFCTSTLATGVNLPAERVIIRTPHVGSKFMSLAMYQQMAGRAGRTGFGRKGESYLICGAKDAEKVGAMLAAGLPNCESQLLKNEEEGLRKLVLSLLHTNIAKTFCNLKEICSRSLVFAQGQIDCLDAKLTGILNQLRDDGMIICDDKGVLVLTRLGDATVKGHMSIKGAIALDHYLQKALKNVVLIDHLHLLFLIAHNQEMKCEVPFLTISAIFSKLSDNEILVAEVVGLDMARINRVAAGFRPQDSEVSVLNKFVVALILNDALNKMTHIASWREIAKKYFLSRGEVNVLLMAASSSASSMIRFCEGFPKLSCLVSLLADIPQKLNYCCKPELFSLMELPAVQKVRAYQLYQAGYTDIKSVANANAGILIGLIPHLTFGQAKKIIAVAKLMVLSQAEELQDEVDNLLKDFNPGLRPE